MNRTIVTKCLSGVLSFACLLQVHAEGWDISGAAIYRHGMKATASGGSYSEGAWGRSLDPGQNATRIGLWNRGAPPSAASFEPIDDIGVYADRTFDNGYNRISAPTTDPNSPFPGRTWYWGYNDVTQYDAQAGVLTYTRDTVSGDNGNYTDLRTINQIQSELEVFDAPMPAGSDRFDAWGARISAARRVIGGAIQWFFVIGADVWQSEDVSVRTRPFSGRMTETSTSTTESEAYAYAVSATYRETYTYSDDLMVVPVTTAPYSGTLAGPGPLMPNLPASRDTQLLASSETVTQTSSGSSRATTGTQIWGLEGIADFDADLNVFSFWLAPRVAVQPGEGSILFFLEPRFSLNYVDMNATRRESYWITPSGGAAVQAGSREDRASEGSWVPGVAIAVGVEADMNELWFAGASAAWDWMLDDPEVQVGPGNISFDLDAFEASIHIGRRL